MTTSTTILGGALLLVLAGGPAFGQAPVIASFGHNGQLVCTNLEPGSAASVEWASSVDGPWTNSWSALTGVAADSNGVIRLSVPMFYRVRGVPRNPAPAKLAWIPPGTFTMGSPTNEPARSPEEGPQTQVTISRGFWMGRFEVTQGEYLALTGSNPSVFGGDSNRPVENVSWEDAVACCAALTAAERGAGRLPAGWAYRLPTEAEWEYACRAGTTTQFSSGTELRSGMANFDGRGEYPPCGGSTYQCANPSGVRLGRTTAVGSYAPNPWGLYDMHGNVAEWCQDWWGPSYAGGAATDPQGPASGLWRVTRGDSWCCEAVFCRSAARDALDHPLDGDPTLGFRVVLAPAR